MMSAQLCVAVFLLTITARAHCSLTADDTEQLKTLHSQGSLTSGALSRMLELDQRDRIRRAETTTSPSTVQYCSEFDYDRISATTSFAEQLPVAYTGALLASLSIIALLGIGAGVGFYLGIGKNVNKLMAMIDAADTDGDGKVSLEEVLGFATKAAAPILGDGGMVGDILKIADSAAHNLLGGEGLGDLGSKTIEFAAKHMGEANITGMLQQVEGMVGEGTLGDMIHVGVEASKLMTDDEGNPLTGDEAVAAAKQLAEMAKTKLVSTVDSLGGEAFVAQAKAFAEKAGADPVEFAKIMAVQAKDRLQQGLSDIGGEGAIEYMQNMANLAGADPKAFASLVQDEAKRKLGEAMAASGGAEALEFAKRMANEAGANPEAFAKMMAEETKDKLGNVFGDVVGKDSVALAKSMAEQAGADPMAFITLMEAQAKSKVNGTLGGVEALDLAKEMAKQAGGDPEVFAKVLATHSTEKFGEVLAAHGGVDAVEFTRALTTKAGGDPAKLAASIAGEANNKYNSTLADNSKKAGEYATKLSEQALSNPEEFAKMMAAKPGVDPEVAAKVMIASAHNPKEFGAVLKKKTASFRQQKGVSDLTKRLADDAGPMLARARSGSIRPDAVKAIGAIDQALALANGTNTVMASAGIHLKLSKDATGLDNDVTLEEAIDFASKMSLAGKQLVGEVEPGTMDRETLKTLATLDTAISLTVSEKQKQMLSQAVDLGLVGTDGNEVYWRGPDDAGSRHGSHSRNASISSKRGVSISSKRGASMRSKRGVSVHRPGTVIATMNHDTSDIDVARREAIKKSKSTQLDGLVNPHFSITVEEP
eukprot:m.198009 g.198009  ORF g.198009 m.198009 type:complete len:820 (+) comp32676_c4_seq1:199-2658(+)